VWIVDTEATGGAQLGSVRAILFKFVLLKFRQIIDILTYNWLIDWFLNSFVTEKNRVEKFVFWHIIN